MIPRSYQTAVGSLVLLLSLVSSCTDAACACSPTVTLVGTYHATRLHFTPTGQTTIDALAAGATLVITLSGNGTTSGTLFVPASLNNGTPQSFDLAGTYQTAGNHVTFSHNADTFLRDVEWTWVGTTLVTTESAGGGQYDVILNQQ